MWPLVNEQIWGLNRDMLNGEVTKIWVIGKVINHMDENVACG